MVITKQMVETVSRFAVHHNGCMQYRFFSQKYVYFPKLLNKISQKYSHYLSLLSKGLT